MSENKNLGHNSKKDFLKKPVEHIDITSFDSRKIISSMGKMSFVSRETANAANIYCLLYTSPSPRDRQKTRMPSSA